MVDDELRALVSVDLPPGFESRLRATIAAQPTPSLWWRVQPLWLAAGATVAGLVAAAWLSAPVERPRDVELLQARAITYTSPLPSRIGSRPAVVRLPPPAARSAIQFDPAESRALHALFSATPAIVVVTMAPPEDAPIAIPAISIAPLAADDAPQGDRQ